MVKKKERKERKETKEKLNRQEEKRRVKDQSRGFRILVWNEAEGSVLARAGMGEESQWVVSQRPVKRERKNVYVCLYDFHRVGDIKGETVVCGVVLILGINERRRVTSKSVIENSKGAVMKESYFTAVNYTGLRLLKEEGESSAFSTFVRSRWIRLEKFIYIYIHVIF